VDPAALFEPQQGRIERPLIQVKDVLGDLLDAVRDTVPVEGASASRVLSTIKSSVPCRTSDLGFMSISPETSTRIAQLVLMVKRREAG
jgi:hypothetical protein